ncbi:MAG: glycosyltransferase [Selenomonas sp.]
MFVFYGGSDLTRETEKAVRALLAVSELALTADIVVGSSNAYIAEVRALCDGHANLHLHVQAQNMAELMASADLALGAGGTTTWERCYLGLPALVTAIAENQFAVAADCGAAGLIRYLGTWTDVTEARLVEDLRACARTEVLRELQRRCQLDVQADDATEADTAGNMEEVLST